MSIKMISDEETSIGDIKEQQGPNNDTNKLDCLDVNSKLYNEKVSVYTVTKLEYIS